MYLIYMDLSHADRPRVRDEWKRIRCEEHPVAYSTYVCAHLIKKPEQTWFGAVPSEEKRWPDAWCSKCNKHFEKEGEWNEKNEGNARIQLLCHVCYEHLRGLRKPH